MRVAKWILPLFLLNMNPWQTCQKVWFLLLSHVCKALAEDWKFLSFVLWSPLGKKKKTKSDLTLCNSQNDTLNLLHSDFILKRRIYKWRTVVRNLGKKHRKWTMLGWASRPEELHKDYLYVIQISSFWKGDDANYVGWVHPVILISWHCPFHDGAHHMNYSETKKRGLPCIKARPKGKKGNFLPIECHINAS